MATRTADLRHEGGYRFVARTGSGFDIPMDAASGASGPRPIEVLAAAIGGCTAMDVVGILDKKRQVISRYALRVEADQREAHPFAFRRVVIIHELEGPALELEAVERAIELSATKYCSVTLGLASGIAELHHRYAVTTPDGAAPVTGEAAVTGPGQQLPPDAP